MECLFDGEGLVPILFPRRIDVEVFEMKMSQSFVECVDECGEFVVGPSSMTGIYYVRNTCLFSRVLTMHGKVLSSAWKAYNNASSSLHCNIIIISMYLSG